MSIKVLLKKIKKLIDKKETTFLTKEEEENLEILKELLEDELKKINFKLLRILNNRKKENKEEFEKIILILIKFYLDNEKLVDLLDEIFNDDEKLKQTKTFKI